ncbi:hypothetical protein CISIN_1g040156mg [Citrus sinensis]|uniref:Uncharacterized protein n=1 Tax=Citrus sinensis TaxID=2711 RepID=A0A067F0Z6_CITSI|nr:hypothetical protein CISIN_1g040156mg [Citrus sinensis]
MYSTVQVLSVLTIYRHSYLGRPFLPIPSRVGVYPLLHCFLIFNFISVFYSRLREFYRCSKCLHRLYLYKNVLYI